jgi:hypothetical protein
MCVSGRSILWGTPEVTPGALWSLSLPKYHVSIGHSFSESDGKVAIIRNSCSKFKVMGRGIKWYEELWAV